MTTEKKQDSQYFNNIKKAEFIESVDEYMKKQDDTYENVFLKLQQQFSDYKTLETRFTSLRNTIQNKLPEIEKTLESLYILKEKENTEEELETDYELTYGTTLATGVIKPGCPVYLCLGAGLMVEHSVDEAIELLTKNISDAQKKIDSYNENIKFLQEQIVITQVSLARLHNWNVVRQRSLKK